MIKLNTINKLDYQTAISLIDKHIHFRWHNRNDNTVETMPGKVIEVNKDYIVIETMDIIMDDINVNNNKMIKKYNIEDLSDIFPFGDSSYNHNFLRLLDDINENDMYNSFFDIKIMEDIVITTKIIDENYPLSITFDTPEGPCEYPLYFIYSIKKNDKD